MKSIKLLPLSHWIAFLVVCLYPLFSVEQIGFLPWMITVAGLALFGLVYHASNRLRPPLKAGFPELCLLGLDAILICMLIYYTAGILSPFFPLLFLLVATASLYGRWTEALFLASIIGGGYAVACVAEGIELAVEGSRLLINVAVLLGSSVLLSYLSELDRREHSKAERIEALYRLSSELMRSMDFRETLRQLLTSTAVFFQADTSSISLLDSESGALSVKDHINAGGQDGPPADMKASEVLTEWVAREKRPLLVNDLSKDPRFSSMPSNGEKTTRSALAAPIMVGDTLMGVLSCASSRPQSFASEDLQMLVTVSNLAASVIARAELYEIVLSRSEVIVNSMNSGLLVTDSCGKVIMANQAAHDLLGLENIPRDVPLRNLLEPHLLDADAVWKHINGAHGVARDQNYADLEVRLKGTPERVLSVRISPIRAGYEHSGGSVVIMEDITERVKVDEIRDDLMLLIARRVEEQTALYEVGRSLTDELETGYLLEFLLSKAMDLVDAELGVLSLRNEQERLQIEVVQGLNGNSTGVSYPSGDYLASVAVEKDEPLRRMEIAPAQAGPWWENYPHNITYIAVPITWQGRNMGLIEVASPSNIREFGDDDLRLLSLFINQAAIALENSNLYRLITEDERRMEAMLHSINDGVIAINNDAKIILVNPAAESILNLPPFHRINNRHIKEVIRNPALCSIFLKSLNAGKEMEEEVHLEPPEWKVLEVQTSLIEIHPGERIGIIAVIRDITALRELEQVKSDFVSTVSHELRTPLTSIKAYIATLRREDVEFDHKTRQEFLKVVEEETDRLTRLISDILDVSRIESGKLELKKRDFDMAKLAGIVTEKMQSHTSNHHIKLLSPAGAILVNGDPDKIEQVVMNLVDNAVKYSPSGGEITVSLEAKNRRVELTVSDQGVGIPPDHLPHIFEKFHRVDNRATREIYGTGLGLYVSKSIIEAHGGTIWAESEPDKGSAFHFTLPLSSRLNHEGQETQETVHGHVKKGVEGEEEEERSSG